MVPAIKEFCPASSSGGSTPTYMPTGEAVSKPSSKSSKPSSKASKPSSKSSKPHKPSSSSSEDEDSSSDSKSGKPGLSMPSSGDLVDHFDFGKSGKSSSSDQHSKSSKTSSTPTTPPEDEDVASMPNSRLLNVEIQYPEVFDQRQELQDVRKEYNDVFGRRLSQHREKQLRNGSLSVGGDTIVKSPRFDKPLKKRLRNRSR